MVLIPMTEPALGTKAPDFRLADVVSGRAVTRDDAAGKKGLLVLFICAHCPYVKHVEEELARIGHDYQDRGLGIVAISANDAVDYPEDAPPHLKAQAEARGFAFPYLYDETQKVARAYGAACTPDVFLYDRDLRLAYRGQLDDSRPRNGKPVTARDLRAAMDLLLEDQPVPPDQKPSVGCSIKWKER